VSIGAWGVHCAAEQQGEVKCWGAHMGSMPRPVADVTDAVQTDYLCSLASDGSVQCWWCNDQGQRGDGTLAPPQQVGVASNCELTTSTVAWPGRAVQVSSGYQHACLVDADGSVACWGDNGYGQLGVPDTGPEMCNYNKPCATEPLQVPGIEDAVQVSAGIGLTCILHADGQVMCIGEYGRQPVALPAPAMQLAARYARACAVLTDGRVFCWSERDWGPEGFSAGIIPTEVAICPGGD
jgi:hypothetical protein